MKSTEILDLMVKDHAKLIGLLKNVEKSINEDSVSLMKVFDKFEWSLEKHLFTEEKAIFTSYSPTNISEGYKMVPELIKEHNEILNKVRLIRKDLLNKRPVDFIGLKEKLTNHKKFEEESLYPKLDQELEVTQKEDIVSKIKDLVY